MKEVFTWLVTITRETLRWRKKLDQPTGGIRVFYGYDSLPTQHDIASGGIVKTLDLQHIFPNTPHAPNLLYLISSSLPPYAPLMVQLAKKAGCKVVLNQNGVAYQGWHGPGWEKTNEHMRKVLHCADYVFYQSHFCKQSADRFLGNRTGNYEILYNPVNTCYFNPADGPVSLSPIRLLLAGTHNHFYRVQTAVDTVELLRNSGVNVKLEVAGRYCWHSDFPFQKEELLHYIKNKSLEKRVVLSGAYSQSQARHLFGRAHLLLHTKYNDPCPRLVVEAMASGLPVVYSASGGTGELVGNQAGVGIRAPVDWDTVHPPSVVELAGAIQRISISYENFSFAARQRALKLFDVKPWLERHRKVFEILLKGNQYV